VISGALVGRASASAIASLCPIRPLEATRGEDGFKPLASCVETT
jgi:hypothetical protein